MDGYCAVSSTQHPPWMQPKFNYTCDDKSRIYFAQNQTIILKIILPCFTQHLATLNNREGCNIIGGLLLTKIIN